MAGKRTTEIEKGIDRKKLYALNDAVKMVKERAKAKFDETVEVAMNLGVDPRHADQMVRGVVNLPNGTGKTVRVAVFAKDAKAEEARKAGAVGQVDHAADHLVGVARVDAEVQRYLDGLVELGGGVGLHQRNRFINAVELLAVDRGEGFLLLGQLCHALSPPQPGGPSRGRSLR